MNPSPDDKKRLLLLIYDLLDESEAKELRSRIDADSDWAEAYRSAKEEASLIAEASRLPNAPQPLLPASDIAQNNSTAADPTIGTASPIKQKDRIMADENSKPKAGKGRTASIGDKKRKSRRSRSNNASKDQNDRSGWLKTIPWIVAVASVLLIGISLFGYAYHQSQLSTIAAGHMRIMVTGPSRIEQGTEAVYKILSTTVTGQPLSSDVKLTFQSAGSKPLILNNETDDEGQLEITIEPEYLAQACTAQLFVEANHETESDDGYVRLAGNVEIEPIRYITRLSTDLPIYQAGRASETVRYRSLMLRRSDMIADHPIPVAFAIKDPSGATVPGSEYQTITDRGVAAGEFQLPSGIAGGRYTLHATSPSDEFDEAELPFFIRKYRPPRLMKELEFLKDSYTEGDHVEADLSVTRAEGGPAAGANVRVRAMVDGRQIYPSAETGETYMATKLTDDGTFRIAFSLPSLIDTVDGRLIISVDDGGTRETLTKPIPLNLGLVDVQFFPESGGLAGNLVNRIYFVARDPLGEPVELKGTVVDSSGNEIAAVETVHQGMGVIRLIPLYGETYKLKLEKPTGIDRMIKIPSITPRKKVVLTTGTGVFDADQPIEVNVRSSQPGLPLVIEASSRGVPAGQTSLVTQVDDDDSSANAVSIDLDENVGGVIRLTLYDYRTSPPTPIAERLVYRRMPRQLDVQIVPEKTEFSPGEPVRFSIEASNEKGAPAANTALGVSVVDQTLYNLTEDDTPQITTWFLLASEVDEPQDLEEADFYLSDDPEAEVALDLLLGTQGWREFVEIPQVEPERLASAATPAVTPDQPELELNDAIAATERAGITVPVGEAAPMLYDNLSLIENDFHQSLDKYRHGRSETVSKIATLALIGGLSLLLAVGFLTLLKIASGAHLWWPAIAACGCCLLIGSILLNPGLIDSQTGGVVAFENFGTRTVAEIAMMSPEKPTEDASEAIDNYLGDFDTDDAIPCEEEPGAEFDEVLILDDGGMPEEAEGGEEAGQIEQWKEEAAQERDEEEIPAAGPEPAMDADVDDFLMVEEIEEDIDFNRIAGERPMDREEEFGWMEAGKRFDGKYRWQAKPQVPLVARRYAHVYTKQADGVRRDFARLLYWDPLVVTDTTGRAEVTFDMPDSVTSFRATADAHQFLLPPQSSDEAASADKKELRIGRIGTGTEILISRIPFHMEPKLPLEVTTGDRIDLPVAVCNDSGKALDVKLSLSVDNDSLLLEDAAEKTMILDPRSRRRHHFPLRVMSDGGETPVLISSETGGGATERGPRLDDAIEQTLEIVPRGFPKEISIAGELKGTNELTVNLPDEWIPGTMRASLTVIPSTLADLQKGMSGILRQPCGCFEQASTANYPNALSLQYMKEHDVVDLETAKKSKRLLDDGYGRLTGYECSEKGYEWFGGDPGHEALTAYGLMEFADMSEVYDVDPEMIERTATWLLGRRDGKGGFERNPRALDSFGAAPKNITDAYITWALAESGRAGQISAEIDHSIAMAESSSDPYLIALAAGAAIDAGRDDTGRALLKKLASLQNEDGHLVGTDGSITRSGGRSLEIETTALAALAWMKRSDYAQNANKAMEWIIASRSGNGTFGATQSTILALKALIEHSKKNRRTAAAGRAIVRIDGEEVSNYVFEAGVRDEIVIEGLEDFLKPGENLLEVELTGDNEMPFTLAVSYRTEKPNSSDDCPVLLTCDAATTEVTAGETVPLTMTVENTTDKGQPMTVAIVGLPAGLEAETAQLEKLREEGTIDYYETRGRELIFYWRGLAPNAKIEWSLELIAAIPGRYTGPASRVYLYYTPEEKQWCEPLTVEIAQGEKETD